MAKYGFKLLLVDLREGQGHTPLDFGAPKRRAVGKIKASVAEPYLDILDNDLKALKADREALTDEDPAVVEVRTSDLADGETVEIVSDDVVDGPDDEDVPEGLAKKPPAVVRIEDFRRLESGMLLNIQYGIVGDHDRALDPQGKRADVPLKGLATTRPYRALLIVPEHGTSGFLAVEVISGSHAGADLPRRLLYAARGHNFKLKLKGPVADAGAVQDLINNGRVKEVELIKSEIGSDANSPKTKSVRMKFPITVGSEEATKILAKVKKWLPTSTSADDLVPAAEATALASILWSDAAALGFDDARVQVVSPKNERRLKPLDRSEGFIYDVGDRELDDDEFVREIWSVARGLFDANQMDMEDGWDSWATADEE